MQMFWQRGYHQVSTRELSDAMGINSCSLYSEFGNKAGLFAAAINRYETEIVPMYIGTLERQGASVETIKQVLNMFAGFADSDEFVPGCLINNTAVELAPSQPESCASIERYVARLTAGYKAAIENEPGVDPSADAAMLANFLVVTTLGLFVLIRAQADHNLLQNAVDMAMRHVTAVVHPPITTTDYR